MDESLIPRVLRELRFPKRPRISVGDKMALYALGHDCVFAIVEIFGRPYPIEGPNNWDKWQVETRPVLSMGYAGAPTLAEISVGQRDLRTSIRQQTHIGLSDSEYEQLVVLLRAAGAAEDSFYRP
jgi:hypothetical protein